MFGQVLSSPSSRLCHLCPGLTVSTAVGLINWGEVPAVVTLDLADIERSGTHRIRDLWGQQDNGETGSTFRAEVPAHGTILILLNSAA